MLGALLLEPVQEMTCVASELKYAGILGSHAGQVAESLGPVLVHDGRSVAQIPVAFELFWVLGPAHYRGVQPLHEPTGGHTRNNVIGKYIRLVPPQGKEFFRVKFFGGWESSKVQLHAPDIFKIGRVGEFLIEEKSPPQVVIDVGKGR